MQQLQGKAGPGSRLSGGQSTIVYAQCKPDASLSDPLLLTTAMSSIHSTLH